MVELGAGKKASGPLRFDEVIGQAEFKDALLAVAASDGLSGLLVQGEKGTAKSTTVRALADLLPEQRAIADCPYGCPPDERAARCVDCRDRADPPTETRPVSLVTLPLGATRDRVVGTLSVEDALDGHSEFEPGLLARANRGILYVDEVNLLDDHLVDVLLDAAAGGVNRVERDGVSHEHPANFTLIGTMNPEEGELRPQLRDRFDLQTTVTACDALDDRVAIVDRVLGRESGTEAPRDGRWSDAGERLQRARKLLAGDEVALPDEFVALAAEVARDAGVDGHRADIAIARTALALAALDGRSGVIETDIERAARLALPHRLASRPFDDTPSTEEILDDHFDTGEEGDGEDSSDAEESSGESDASDANGDEETDSPDSGDRDGDSTPSDDGTSQEHGADSDGQAAADSDGPPTDAGNGDGSDDGDQQSEDQREQDQETPLLPGQARADVGEATQPAMALDDVTADIESARSGSRVGTAATADNEGPRRRTRAADDRDRVDAAASVRAAARAGRDEVTTRDLRASVRSGSGGALVTFVVDASASMRPAMCDAKGVVMELLTDAYQHRDEVAFVTFAGEGADVLLPPTDSVSLAARHLKELPTGDRTPLAEGLRTAEDVISRADPAASVTVVVTDGRANGAGESPVSAVRAAGTELASVTDELLVVDASPDSRAGVTDMLVNATDARRVGLDALAADSVDALAGAAHE